MTRKTLALLGVLALTTAVAAQIKVNVQLVNVIATVTDSRGRYVPDLKISDFTLAEDGTRQEITHFAFSQDLPVSVGIVIDTSGSMERKISTATRAVDRFLRDIHADDDVFIMTFDDHVNVVQDFTSDRDRLWRALEKIHLGNGTSLYDGVVAGVQKLQKGGKYQKKAILLLSDGVDTESVRSYEAARSAVRESEMLLYALGIAPDGSITTTSPGRIPGTTGPRIPTPQPGGGTYPGRGPVIGIPFPGGGATIPIPIPGRKNQFPPSQTGAGANDNDFDMTVLDALADDSGGKAWKISIGSNGRNRIQDALDEIANELRNQYSIGYYPAHDLKDGKWHRTQLETKNPDYRVRYKEDYFGK
jgi:Ca-activated chloride channel family protein